MLAFLVFAAEGASDHGSKTAFYVAGGALALWAVLLGGIGAMRPAFAQGEGTARAIMAGTVVLALLTVSMAVVTSS